MHSVLAAPRIPVLAVAFGAATSLITYIVALTGPGATDQESTETPLPPPAYGCILESVRPSTIAVSPETLGWPSECAQEVADARLNTERLGAGFDRMVPDSAAPAGLRFPNDTGLQIASTEGRTLDPFLLERDEQLGGWRTGGYIEHGFVIALNQLTVGGRTLAFELLYPYDGLGKTAVPDRVAALFRNAGRRCLERFQ